MKNALQCTNGRHPPIWRSSVSAQIWSSIFLIAKRLELPVCKSKHQAKRFQLHPDGPGRCRCRFRSCNFARHDRITRGRVEHAQDDFIGIRQRREQARDRGVHILEALLHEFLRGSLGRRTLIPGMNLPGLPFHFEPIAHALERKSVVANTRPPIHLERADHFAPKPLLRQVRYESFRCPYHRPVPSS